MQNINQIPQIDAKYIIYYNLLKLGDEVTDVKRFRRRAIYVLHLINGIKALKDWKDKAVKEIKEEIKKKIETGEVKFNDTSVDFEFYLYCGMAEKVILKMEETNMIVKDKRDDLYI